MGYRRVFLHVPFLSLRLMAYIAALLTPVPAPITRSLMEGLRNDVVCGDDRLRTLLPFSPLPFRVAVLAAMSREEQDRVHTRWSDAYPPAHELAIKLHELAAPPCFQSRYEIETDDAAAALFGSLCRIGGRQGWLHGNWMWRLRGAADRLLAGVGMQRGRRSASELRVNDVVDFWRVEDLVPNHRLLLRAEMKVPGKAWLEFVIGPAAAGPGRRLSVTAYFETRSLFGRLYWYAFWPLHRYLFGNLLREIVSRSA